MNKLIILVIAAFVTMIYTGCKKETTCIDGNSDLVQEQRELDQFNKVSVIGSFITTLYQSDNSRVDFFAESNIIPIIRSDVSNQQLRIIVQDGNCYNTNRPVEVYINTPDYEEVSIDGSGDVSANNLNLDNLKLSLNGSGSLNALIDLQNIDMSLKGSGDINIAGSGGMGDLLNSGSGIIYSSNFAQDTVYVTVSGSGDVHINVSTFLDVTISGSGSVYYKGNPSTINQSITGSGELIDAG